MTWRILTNDVLGEGFEFHHINWAYFNISSAFTVWQGEYLSYFLGRNTWLIMMVVMYLTGYYLWQRRNPELIKQFPLGAVSLIAVSFVFIVVYVLGMVMVVLFLDSGAMPQARYLLPLRVIVVFLYLAFVYVVASLNDKARQARIIFISTCSFAIIIGNIVAVSGWVKERHSKGVLLNGVDWVGSEIVTEIRKMPSNTVIYSNNAKAVYLLAERVATLVDSKEDLKNDGFVQRMRGDFRRGKGMFVFCNQRYDGCNDLKCGALTMDDIQAKLSLRLLRRLKDGAIYIWDSSAD